MYVILKQVNGHEQVFSNELKMQKDELEFAVDNLNDIRHESEMAA